jgi:spore photoproduct lyase
MIEVRERKSKFVKLFDKTPESICCPHFYELILSNGCPFNCSYCYLKLTFRGKTNPVLFRNDWSQVQAELDAFDHGVFSTGELADSLAVIPPLLEKALDYFESQKGKYLLLLTKSNNIDILRNRAPNQQIITSFSINSMPAAKEYEKGAPDPMKRLEAAKELKDLGWRVRIRIDPIILESGLEYYEPICKAMSLLAPEVVTIGTLRQYPGVHRFSKEAPREGLKRAPDGRMRYPTQQRIDTYKQISEWLGFQPALCKEAFKMWEALGWEFRECNCTNGSERVPFTSLIGKAAGGIDGN